MDDSDWEALRDALRSLEAGSELRTPVSDRRFAVERVDDDGIGVRFRDSDETRALRREQFEALADRLEAAAVGADVLQPLVEPYASLLTVGEAVTVDDGQLRWEPAAATGGESPYLVPAVETRTSSERLRDDALLLVDELERRDADAAALETETLTDRYVLCSDVQRGADRLRRDARDVLLDRLGPDQRLHGRFGTVRRTSRDRRRAVDDETVFDVLDEHGVPREWVLGVDETKLEIVASVTDVPAEDVFEVDESVYVQKTGVDESEKGRRLQGLRSRLDDLDDAEAEAAIRSDLDEIEDRIEEALSVG